VCRYENRLVRHGGRVEMISGDQQAQLTSGGGVKGEREKRKRPGTKRPAQEPSPPTLNTYRTSQLQI
jgi:hypothetical protein